MDACMIKALDDGADARSLPERGLPLPEKGLPVAHLPGRTFRKDAQGTRLYAAADATLHASETIFSCFAAADGGGLAQGSLSPAFPVRSLLCRRNRACAKRYEISVIPSPTGPAVMAAQIFVVEPPIVRRGFASAVIVENDLSICGETASVAGARCHLPDPVSDLALANIFLRVATASRSSGPHIRRPTDMKTLVFSKQDGALYARRVLTARTDGNPPKEERSCVERCRDQRLAFVGISRSSVSQNSASTRGEGRMAMRSSVHAGAVSHGSTASAGCYGRAKRKI
jgi:hypothetical protein